MLFISLANHSSCFLERHRNHNFSRATEITFPSVEAYKENRVTVFIKINKFPICLNARTKHEIGRNRSWLPLKDVDSGFHTVDSGLHTMDTWFHALDSEFQNRKFCWIPDYFISGDLQLRAREKEYPIAWYFTLLEYIKLNNFELAYAVGTKIVYFSCHASLLHLHLPSR